MVTGEYKFMSCLTLFGRDMSNEFGEAFVLDPYGLTQFHESCMMALRILHNHCGHRHQLQVSTLLPPSHPRTSPTHTATINSGNPEVRM